MHLSPFFHHLHSAYQAELDDLSQDSEGRNVLRQRLDAMRGELGFLLQMLERSPEMVAPVLHQGFRFRNERVLLQLLQSEADTLLPWSTVHAALELSPWAEKLVAQILPAPGGDAFLSVCAALEYLQGKPALAPQHPETAQDPDGDDDEGPHDSDSAPGQRDADEHSDPSAHLDQDEDRGAHDKAGNDWLVQQGFDSKD